MTEREKDQKGKNTEVKTFPVPINPGENRGNITISTNTYSKPSKEQLINQALNFQSQGNISEASKYYKYFIDQGYKDHRVFYNYGIILHRLGKSKEAELSYLKAIEIKPDFAYAHYNLGRILKSLGKSNEAILYIKKAIELNPNHAEFYSQLGSILNNLGKHKEAEETMRKAVEVKPNFYQAHLAHGDILYELGKYDKAFISEWKGIKKNPSYIIINNYIATAKVIKKTAFFVHSITIFDHFKPVIEIDPKFFEIVVSKRIKERIINKIKDEIKCRTIKIRTSEELIKNNLIYEKLVSNHGNISIDFIEVKNNNKVNINVPIIKLLGKKNIRFMYAAGKTKWNLSYWNKYYDGILCFGKFHENLFKIKHKIPTAQMGYPRFDKYFKPGINKNKIIKKYNCNPNKKTIVWLPTWTNLSSIGLYIDAIISLKKQNNIIVKPHPLMKDNDPINYEKIYKADFCHVLNNDEDNLPLYAIADLMLFDYGGPMFGALYLNKNIAFLDMKSESKNHIHLGKLSSEEYLKSFFPERVAKLENIKFVCNYCLKNPPSGDVMKMVREEFFNTNYQGTSAERAYKLLTSDQWLI